jgi:hypothetical protein
VRFKTASGSIVKRAPFEHITEHSLGGYGLGNGARHGNPLAVKTSLAGSATEAFQRCAGNVTNRCHLADDRAVIVLTFMRESMLYGGAAFVLQV